VRLSNKIYFVMVFIGRKRERNDRNNCTAIPATFAATSTAFSLVSDPFCAQPSSDPTNPEFARTATLSNTHGTPIVRRGGRSPHRTFRVPWRWQR
jgi:hypothetical protein